MSLFSTQARHFHTKNLFVVQFLECTYGHNATADLTSCIKISRDKEKFVLYFMDDVHNIVYNELVKIDAKQIKIAIHYKRADFNKSNEDYEVTIIQGDARFNPCSYGIFLDSTPDEVEDRILELQLLSPSIVSTQRY